MVLRVLIMTSHEDLASSNIRSQFLALFPFTLSANPSNPHIKTCHTYAPTSPHDDVQFTLWWIDTPMTKLDEYFTNADLDTDLLIFTSRHRSQSGNPGLLCHTPGNWGESADVGGKPGHIAMGSGLLQYYFYKFLSQYRTERNFVFPVDPEVTHHGPTELAIPLGFIELGSSEPDWHNVEGAQIVAHAAISTCFELATHHFHNGAWEKKDIKVVVGFGGTHYMPNFSRLILDKHGYAHVVPKYALLQMNASMIHQIQQRVLEPIDYWVVDWKGMNSAEKNQLMPLLEASGIPIKKTKDLEKII